MTRAAARNFERGSHPLAEPPRGFASPRGGTQRRASRSLAGGRDARTPVERQPKRPRKARPAPPRVCWFPEPKPLHPESRLMVLGIMADAGAAVFAEWWSA